MPILIAGMRKEFVNDFIVGMEELGIKTCGEPFEIDGIWHVMYRPIGREQKAKSEQYITDRFIKGLM